MHTRRHTHTHTLLWEQQPEEPAEMVDEGGASVSELANQLTMDENAPAEEEPGSSFQQKWRHFCLNYMLVNFL